MRSKTCCVAVVEMEKKEMRSREQANAPSNETSCAKKIAQPYEIDSSKMERYAHSRPHDETEQKHEPLRKNPQKTGSDDGEDAAVDDRSS